MRKNVRLEQGHCSVWRRKMRVFNEDKTLELFDYDLTKGYLKDDRLFVCHHDAVAPSEGIYHYETKKGRVKKIWDEVPRSGADPYDEYEQIMVFVEYSEAELLENRKKELRALRKEKCFPVINRGMMWYNRLTAEQEIELFDWYNAWLDVTETLKVPKTPEWVNKKINDQEVY